MANSRKGPISLNSGLLANSSNSPAPLKITYIRKAMVVMAKNLNRKWKNTLCNGFPSMVLPSLFLF
ncbi:MAG: hypothetical protein A2464_04865 [Deltaproteobacteria bacterium RIFOXYC2_FULL_48_10]|nr:MAG: hypothetical protein A2464_04865 [Deltaproteobacteria bacterium RIFOXYC2_FULL_48_10]